MEFWRLSRSGLQVIVMWGWPESYIFRIGALDLELPQYSSIALSFAVVPVTTSCVHAGDLVGARCTDLHGAPDWSRATAMARSTRLGAESTWQDAGSCPLFLEHCLDRGSCDLTYPDWGLHLEDLASISHVSMARQDSRATSLLLPCAERGRCHALRYVRPMSRPVPPGGNAPFSLDRRQAVSVLAVLWGRICGHTEVESLRRPTPRRRPNDPAVQIMRVM